MIAINNECERLRVRGRCPLLQAYIDGGLTDNLPRFTDVRTITISPFSGEAHISPRDLSMFTGTAFDWGIKFANQEMKVF